MPVADIAVYIGAQVDALAVVGCALEDEFVEDDGGFSFGEGEEGNEEVDAACDRGLCWSVTSLE